MKPPTVCHVTSMDSHKIFLANNFCHDYITQQFSQFSLDALSTYSGSKILTLQVLLTC